MTKMGIGLQLYTLRDDMKADMEATLRQVAALGYEGVEFAGYFGMPAEQLRSLLDELGLKAIGSHVGWQAMCDDLDGQIDYLQTIGGQYLICPWLAQDKRESADSWKAVIDAFEETGRKVRERGLQFAYHNHAFEFDIRVDGDWAFDAVYKRTQPANVQVEMDVCWVQYAGQDPLAYIQSYAGRLPLLHLKDFRKNESGMQTLELGQGVVPLQDVIKASGEAGVKWLIVEQDHCQNPPLVSVANSMDWLKKHYLK